MLENLDEKLNVFDRAKEALMNAPQDAFGVTSIQTL